MFFRLLFVFDILFNLFWIDLWSSAGKEVSYWLSIRAVFYFMPSYCTFSFSVFLGGQDVEFDCIDS